MLENLENTMVPESENPSLQTISREVIGLAWLAGFLEGDGSLFASFGYAKNIDGSVRKILHTRVVFSNTDARPLNAVAQFLTLLNVGFVWSLSKAKDSRRSCATLIVHGQRTVLALLTCLLPFLAGKRAQAEKMMEIIRKRQEVPYGDYSSQIDWSAIERMIEECSILKHQCIDPSTTTRSPSQLLRW